MVSEAALRGYILEEVLAQLLQSSGYRLLVSANQDPDALVRGAHGLLVRGRGTDHQADVLGELMLPAPFALPLRIFVEAKFRGTKSDLRDVRNAHGVQHDVNEQYSTATVGNRTMPLRRYLYRYALFSASGFSRPAQRFALAQQISLIDISGPAFGELRDAVGAAARQLYLLATEMPGEEAFPRGQMRTALRLALGTWTADETLTDDPRQSGHRASLVAELNPARREAVRLPDDVLAGIAAQLDARAVGDLLLGFPAGPFVLVLRPDDLTAFRDYVRAHGSDIAVNIELGRRDLSADWSVVPADGSGGFRLRFGLPDILTDWLLADDGAAVMRARDIKTGLLSSIAVFQDQQLVRLLFQPSRRRRSGA